MQKSFVSTILLNFVQNDFSLAAISKLIDNLAHFVVVDPEESTEVKDNCTIQLPKSKPSLALAINGSTAPDETDGGPYSAYSVSSANSETLYKIFQKLNELHLGQKQLPGQVLQAICNGNDSMQQGAHMVDSSHKKCQEKQAELEGRIVELEKKMQLMLHQMKSVMPHSPELS